MHSESEKPLLVFRFEQPKAKIALLAACQARGWRALDLSITQHIIPKGVNPKFAILRQSTQTPLGKELKARGCHIVQMTATKAQFGYDVPSVSSDRETEGRLAAEHFAERGFRSVGDIIKQTAPLAHATFFEHAASLGCRCYALEIKPAQPGKMESQAKSYEREFAAFSKWIDTVEKPIGLMMESDQLAARFAFMCMQLDIRIPEDVAILGRSNMIEYCELGTVGLSSIEIDEEGRINAIISILDDLDAGREPPKEPVVIPPKGIVVRQSTDVMATSHPDAAKALRYIWQNYASPNMSVQAVADWAGFSRRKLEYLFSRELGQGVNSMIAARRIERCRQLLTTTDMKVSEICSRIGFQSPGHLQRAFKRRYGLALNKYRLRSRGIKP